MDAFISQVLSGLAAGSIYASLSLALVMIYRSTHLINFAQGEMAMMSTYIAWFLINAGMPIWVAYAATVAVSFLIGMAIQGSIIRFASNAAPIVAVTVTVGLFLVINSCVGLVFTYVTHHFPSGFGEQPIFANQYISNHEIGMLATVLLMLAVLYAFFRGTRIGLAMRGAATNPTSSALVGISVPVMHALGWGMAASVGAVSGILIAPVVFLEPHFMFNVLIYAIAGSTLGGIDNPLGAVIGGFLIGVLENLLSAYVVGPDLRLTVVLVVIFCVLVFRPSGLLGHTYQKRV